MEQAVVFKPRARLMSQLGEQLIKDENIAVLELIKNSYDADAKNVKVTLKNIDDPEAAIIIIEDNGDGMSLDIVKNCWMEPGTDYKENKLKQMIDEDVRSPLNRLPMGEKGIGRFGVHKLGNKITLITRSMGCNEVYLQIDWTDFQASKYLSDVPIKVTERKPTRNYLDSSPKGTIIIIEKLKCRWNKSKVRELYRSVNSLNSPFKSLDSFEVKFETDKEEWLEGLLQYSDIKDYVLFTAKMTLSGDKILNYNYKFKPWKSMGKLDERNIPIPTMDMFEVVKEKNDKGKIVRIFKPINLNDYNIGEVEIQLYSFDLETPILKLELSDISGIKKYLGTNGGIFVYRDNIRIYSAGEDDWLELESARVNAPVDKISNNQVIGSVNISREHSSALKEKTNREGFIEDSAYDTFKKAVQFAVHKFERDRAVDKQDLKKYYGATSKFEPVMAQVSFLKEKVKTKISDEKLKKEIFGCLQNIEKDYQHITEVYQKSSSAGLSMSIVLHEIDKVISELEHAIIEDDSSDHVRSLVSRLGSLTDGYASVVKSKSIKLFDIKKMIEQSLFLVDFRLIAHDIAVERQYLKSKTDFKVKGNESLIVSSIINIIDNAIWWMNFAKVSVKKMYFDITRDIPGYLSIVIADNGKGFTIPTEIVTRPFITDKPGGMGLGLHLASELMKQHGGNLLFPEFDDLKLPEEYKNGAIIALSFKEE